MSATTNAIEHVFTTAGLGLAPFTLLGVRDNGGSKMLRTTDPKTGIDEITQWGGTCWFCGKAIMVLCDVRSADGRVSTVGSSCVAKTGDRGLKRLVNQEVSKARKATRKAKLQARKAAVETILSSHPELMTADTHPQAWRAEKGETLRDWAVWMLGNAGASGQTSACIRIERALKAVA